MEEKEPSRRNVLNILLGVGGVATAGSIAYPVIMFLQPPSRPEHTLHSITLDKKFSEIAPGEWFIFRFGNKPGLLICTEEAGEKKLYAYDAICTHLECIVEFQPENNTIFCPCHNGRFDLNGNNIGGPPPRPLDKFAVQVSEDVVKIVKES